ncbi:hypothetical protein, conserved [Eimeria tenella]|uniref:Uncharacterized protein n=1 Tax=Eimeria tenella TaxID=5802 RepID=U6KWY0_EIMTE|nr:hypothetical protein, conserved [Eimeria tenella]CDJ40874.1 hypothetical protein, conserved [Eimeria tenella]|eukprot:XP_013231624.1 hypothetical protein, conserved [Eimeria tenella]
MLYDQLPPLKNLHHHLELMSLDCANLFAAPKTGLLISVVKQQQQQQQQKQQRSGGNHSGSSSTQEAIQKQQ